MDYVDFGFIWDLIVALNIVGAYASAIGISLIILNGFLVFANDKIENIFRILSAAFLVTIFISVIIFISCIFYTILAYIGNSIIYLRDVARRY